MNIFRTLEWAVLVALGVALIIQVADVRTQVLTHCAAKP